VKGASVTSVGGAGRPRSPTPETTARFDAPENVAAGVIAPLVLSFETEAALAVLGAISGFSSALACRRAGPAQ
jgi:hypothetical protein